jgi:hypothetical protein
MWVKCNAVMPVSHYIILLHNIMHMYYSDYTSGV